MDRASLYYYVGSKEELFHEVVGGAVATNADAAEQVLAGPGRAPDKLRRLITDLMVSYAGTYPFLFVYIQENLGHATRDRSPWARKMARHDKRHENAVVALVQAGIDEGTLRGETQAWVLAFGIIGMVAWSNRWFNPNESSVPAAEIGAAYAEALLGACRPAGSVGGIQRGHLHTSTPPAGCCPASTRLPAGLRPMIVRDRPARPAGVCTSN